jgi:hypothetical protein
MPQWRVTMLHKVLYEGIGAGSAEKERQQVMILHNALSISNDVLGNRVKMSANCLV